MPELPDLTLYAENLRKSLVGRRAISADVFNRAKVNAAPDAFSKALAGQTISAILRDGKEMRFCFANQQALTVHLMLCGQFTLTPFREIFDIDNKVICLGLDDGRALTVADALHMARVTLGPPDSPVPDALSDAFTPAYLLEMARRRPAMGVKAFLIDQHIVRGIGNAYADEILYRADISPKSRMGRIPPEVLAALHAAIRWTLEDAIGQLRRICPDSISGEERSFLRVHNRLLTATADGEPILRENIDKKKTYYTQKQRLF